MPFVQRALKAVLVSGEGMHLRSSEPGAGAVGEAGCPAEFLPVPLFVGVCSRRVQGNLGEYYNTDSGEI